MNMNDSMSITIPKRILSQVTNGYPARVAGQYTDMYRLITEHAELIGEISGGLRYRAVDSRDLPVVGDWVIIDRPEGEHGHAVITSVLPRTSWVERSAADSGGREVQILASNIDMIGICMGLDRDFNIRRLERYLSIVYNSGAVPLVILTKGDLSEDLQSQESLAQQAAFGVDVIVTSSVNRTGFERLSQHLGHGRTLAFLGSSGVGKSTVINHLLGNERAAVSHVRSDGKGRHTTTSRELYLLPDGTCLIDTPGLREIQLSGESDVDATFADIEQLAQACRFSDCTHTREPGCAVREAIESGVLDQARFDNYVKMKHELSYIGLDSRQREKKKLKRMFSDVGSFKEVRDFAKKRPKRES